MSKAAKPEKFKESTKWEDWKPTFLNYLCSIPGRDAVPLRYVCRDKNEAGVTAASEDFLDDYVVAAPVSGNAYAINAVQVHTFCLTLSAAMTLQRPKSRGSVVRTMDAKRSSV